MSTSAHMVFTWLHILPGLAGNQLEIATQLNWHIFVMIGMIHEAQNAPIDTISQH